MTERGIAFLAACIGIYVLLVHETKSYFLPLILMLSIPFTIIGILPGFWLLNLLGTGPIDGVPDPIFSGLAWALIFGLLVSSLFTLVLVPMVYVMVYGKKHRAEATS